MKNQLSEWRSVFLSDLGDLRNGVNFSRGSMGESRMTSHALINVKDIFRSGTFLDPRALDGVELPNSPSVAKNSMAAGDIYFVRSSVKRAGVGQVSLARSSDHRVVHCGFVTRARITDPDADPLFLVYALGSPENREKIIALSSGSAITNLSQNALGRLPITLPPLREQTKIASILSAYDDLIENNTRRIQILEEMAQAIYREWFVEFRFPGHEDVRMVDSELGPIPEGWAIQAFSKLAEFVNGYAFKPSDWGVDGLPIVKIRELKGGVSLGTPRYPVGGLPAKYLIKSGDILFSWSADLETYSWPYGEAWLNQHLFNVAPSPGIQKLFLFHSLRAHMDEFRGRALGTTMRHIKRSALGQVKTVVPPVDLLARFDNLVVPIDELRRNLTATNRNLRESRDLLLPRLISGEIDVSNLYIGNAEPAA